MKFTNQFRTIRGIFYLAVILSCFAFTSAKSASLKFSNATTVNIIFTNNKTIKRNLNIAIGPLANGDFGSGRIGGEKDNSNNIDSSISNNC